MTDKKVNYPENQSWVNIEFQKFAYHEVWLYGVEGRRKIDEENSDKWTWFFKMSLCIVQKSECCVFGASVVLVHKLVWV